MNIGAHAKPRRRVISDGREKSTAKFFTSKPNASGWSGILRVKSFIVCSLGQTVAITSMISAMGECWWRSDARRDRSNARRLLAADGWHSICAVAEGEGAPLNKSHLGSARGRMHLPKWVRCGRTDDERLLHTSDLQSLVTVGTTAGRFVPNPAKASRSATAWETGPRWPLA